MFKPGEKVICVDASVNQKASEFYQEWLVEGKEYTVKRCEGSLNGVPRVLLEEVRNDSVFVAEIGGKIEPGFSSKRFKSVDTLYAEDSVEESEVIYN